MRSVGRVCAFGVAVAAVVGGSPPAIADPVTDPLPAASQLTGGAYPEKFLYFSGFDLWRGGGSFTAACNGHRAA
jgi:hypothetical protein